ncbi:MAG: glutamate:Na+ symporter, ESS family [Bacteroidetes bacterium HLUCCA01]|nr:MAG: glutamate:Na+ symporter, ESS family [Bacteroidetes bacterium HLUCCA01]
MELWDANIPVGQVFIDFSVLGGLLIAGGWLQNRIGWIKRNRIPINVIGGMTGLLISFSGLAGDFIDSNRLGYYVYHLLALLFIALGLRSQRKGTGVDAAKFGLMYIATYLVQAIVGLSITFLLLFTIREDLFAGIGLLMPLAFGMNPGIAYSIGQNWESYGFTYGGTTGLAFAAIGFAVAYTVGLRMINRSQGVVTIPKEAAQAECTDHVTVSVNYDSGTLHVGLIALTYLLTYGFMHLLAALLTLAGLPHEANTMWSFHFVFAALLALAVRKIFDALGASSWIENPRMTSISNVTMDLMVVASIAAITIAVVQQYWLELILLGSITAFSTWLFIHWSVPRLYKVPDLGRKVALFGNMTGTMQSALVLLRVVDPRLQTSVSQELVYGSGLAMLFGFPLLLIINAPVLYFENYTTGFAFAFGLVVIYLLFILLALWRLSRRH